MPSRLSDMNKSTHLTKLVIGYNPPSNLDNEPLYKSLMKKGILTSDRDGFYWDKGVVKKMNDTDKMVLITTLEMLNMTWHDVDEI